jgi:hypothetical protein
MSFTRQYWHQTVREYSGYEISFSSDRLPALAVIVRQYANAHPEVGRYVAGMWEKALLSDLIWVSRQYKRYPRPRPQGMVYPSWSWISIGQYAWIASAVQQMAPDDMTVVGHEIHLVGPDEYGAIRRGALELETYIAEARFVWTDRWRALVSAVQPLQG